MKGSGRRLQVSASGRWYLAMTIGMGVVAMATANNVLYLIESLLLSATILSGILSERAISAIRFDVIRAPAIAGEVSRDLLRVTNSRRFTVFSVQIGEWRQGRFFPIAYVPRLEGRSQANFPSRQGFEARGRHDWESLAIATSYPFGFARKVKFAPGQGSRLVWPSRKNSSTHPGGQGGGSSALRSGPTLVEGEIRPFTDGDDARDVVWTLSARGGDPVVRPRRAEGADPVVILDLRNEPGAEFESRVAAAAQRFHDLEEGSSSGVLALVESSGKRIFSGKKAALDQLALAQAEGRRSA